MPAGDILSQAMILPELTERLSRLLQINRLASLSDEVRSIEARALSELELGWIQSIFDASIGWETADLSKTKVVAEGPLSEGFTLVLQAPAPENANAKASRHSVAQLWIEFDEHITINIQLAQFQGRLQELYVLIFDGKHPKRRIRTAPAACIEFSRDVAGFGA